MPRFIKRYFGQSVEAAWLNFLAVLAGFVGLFLAVWPTVRGRGVDHVIIAELLTFTGASLGLNQWLTKTPKHAVPTSIAGSPSDGE